MNVLGLNDNDLVHSGHCKVLLVIFSIDFIFTFLSLTSTHQTTEKNFLPLVSLVSTGTCIWCSFSWEWDFSCVKSYWILVGSMIQFVFHLNSLFQTCFIIRARYIQVFENTVIEKPIFVSFLLYRQIEFSVLSQILCPGQLHVCMTW